MKDKDIASNDELATMIENTSSSKAHFLMAEIIRTGHIETNLHLIRYAKDNKCKPADLVQALLETVIIDILPLVKDTAELDPITAAGYLTKAFQKTALNMMLINYLKKD